MKAERNYQPVMLSDASSQTLWQAIGANLLSPGPYLFWSMLAGPILVGEERVLDPGAEAGPQVLVVACTH